MQERRIEPRMLCSDLMDVRWTDESGRSVKALANLEDISTSGACLQMDVPVPTGTRLHICHPNVEFDGRVRYCVFRDTGYFAGIEFEDGFEWDDKLFRPEHLLDPRTLIGMEPARGPRQAPRRVQ
jgi:PilZ domain